jgi:hypothetical protein
MRLRTSSNTKNLALLVYCIAIISIVQVGLSDDVLGASGTRTIPYDEGDREDVPSAAARISGLRCSGVHGGCCYSFDIEVFESCWKPVYSIRIEQIGPSFVEPVSWPRGWSAETVPALLGSPNTTVFSTVEEPIQPGTLVSGFALVSYAATASFRWFPADANGILLGRATRVDLACATESEPSSWGSIKALYK